MGLSSACARAGFTCRHRWQESWRLCWGWITGLRHSPTFASVSQSLSQLAAAQQLHPAPGRRSLQFSSKRKRRRANHRHHRARRRLPADRSHRILQNARSRRSRITAVSVDGGKNAPSKASSADGEVMLDIEVAGSVAPGAKIAVYFTPNTDQGFIDAITTAVHDATNKPSAISISWGGPESTWTQQSMTALDAACQSAAALGITITVAAGDNGSTDGLTGNNVDFPASSPHVLACGGTKLDANGATIVSEVVWNELANKEGATGGGVSKVFALPTWQSNANVPAPSTSTGGRGVPDVAGDADPTTGYTIRVDGETTVIGGTSAVAPLWAGLVAVANQQLGTQVGFIQPAIYAAKAVTAFNDITQGNNGAFSAGPGWDACTGLGSPIASKLIPLLTPASASTKSSSKLSGKWARTAMKAAAARPRSKRRAK